MRSSRILYKLAIWLWPLSHVADRVGRLPVVGRLLSPFFGERQCSATIIPVHQVIRGTESVPLPYLVLAPLLEQASYRFIMKECVCRSGEGCQTYPRDLGCIFLGDGAREIDAHLGQPATVAEALAHVRQALDLGLVPMIAHASMDAFVLGIRQYDRMLAICFCCDCCCTIRGSLRDGPRQFWERVTRLPGLQVKVDGACVGCGRCVSVCHVQAIQLAGGRAHINGTCKGCGRCVAQCPHGAIEMSLPNQAEVLRRLQTRIRERTDIGAKER
jgi:ferredoxin